MLRKIIILLIPAFLYAALVQSQYVLKMANDRAALYDYTEAKPLYAKAYKKKKTIDAARGLAQIYTETKDYAFAESWCAKVVAMPGHTPEDELAYAEVLMNNSKYAEAKQQLQSYLGQRRDDKRAANLLAGCDAAQDWLAHPVPGSIENMQALNTQYSDWGTAMFQNKFIFASDRPYDSSRKQPFFSTSNVKRKYYGMTGNGYLHLYESNGKDSASAVLLNKGLNGDYHSASATYTADGKEMYYAATFLQKKGRSFLGKEEPYTLNIEVKKSGWDTARQAWGQALDFPYNEIFKYSVGDPWITPDGQTLYFAANYGAGNIGGTDIYYAKRDVNGQWQQPANMGPSINTEGDERTPFFDNAGNFYFASDGRVGMGGLDIYKAIPDGNGGWTVTNMGCPVNSPQDDFAPFFASDQTVYFSSNRLQGKGSDDIYRFNFARILKFTFEGTIRDSKTKEPLSNVVITLFNNSTQTPEKAITDANGRFRFKLDSVATYQLSAVKTDYATVTGIDVTTAELTTSQTLKKDIVLSKIELQKPVKLENIYFDLDKWNIRPDAAKDLDALVKLLQDNPTWQVEMSSHTDSRASDSYNMKLSQRRAESTVKYLVDHGIAADRLSAKGYGETRLVNKCSNGVACTEEEHQQNRRTEFTILDK